MLKKRFILLSTLLFFVSISSIAQVNLQTGSATFSLPMFNWQDDKSRLNSIVALSYNSGSGLKVNDLASNIGQGWNLVAGGVITRMQVGEPDDQAAYGSSDPADVNKYPAGILFAPFAPSNGCPNALIKYPLYKKKNQVYTLPNELAEDRQLDYFTFQFNGKAGTFVLDRFDIGNCKSLGDTKMKITFQQADMTGQQIRTRINSFTIQDVDGLIYKFNVVGKTKALQLNYCDKTLYPLRHEPKFRNLRVYQQTGFDWLVNPWIITSWYLAEIKDPLTLRTISFNYDTASISMMAGTDFAYNSVKDYAVVTYKQSITKTPEISSIAYPDGHNVSFNYGAFRVDVNGEKILSSVDITYFGRYLSKYQLNTSYFIRNRYGNPTTDFQKQSARLCLRSVQKIGPDLKEDSPPYVFDYYLGTNADDDFVPPPFFYAKDIWGFYNGKNSVRFEDNTPVSLTKKVIDLLHNEIKGLCFWHNGVSGPYLNPKNHYARNGLLRQIIYPTGGTLSYEYDQNTGIIYDQSTAQMVGGVHVSTTSSTDGGYSNGCSNPIITNYNYVMSDGATPSLWGLEMPQNGMWSASHYSPEDKKFHWTLSCFTGCCYYKYMYPGIQTKQQAINVTDFNKIMNVVSIALSIYGVLSTVQEIITVILGGNPVALIIDAVISLIETAISCLTNYDKDPSTTIYYNMDLNAISPLPAQFKRVEIVENPGTIGKTVQTFTSKDDYPLWVPEVLPQTPPSNQNVFSAKQRFAPWAYGLPRVTTVLDASGNKVRETENIYNFNTSYFTHCPGPHYNRTLLLKNALGNISCKCQVIQSYSQKKTVFFDQNIYNQLPFQTTSNNDMYVDIYDLYTGRTELDTTYERVFKPNSNTEYVETVTGYAYNDENYEVRLVKTIQSDGTYKQKNIYYSIDFIKMHGACYGLLGSATTNPELINLVQNNIISVPVEQNEMLYDPNSSTYKFLYDKASLFTTVGNGDIRPVETLEGRFIQPADRTSPWSSFDANFNYVQPGPLLDPANPDRSFYKTTQAFTYDGTANLIGLKDEGNRIVTNIYGYNDKYIIASVINADPLLDHCAYANFEQTTPWVGWTLQGAPSYNTTTVITGLQSFNLSTSTSFQTNLNTAKAYTVSFWATSTISVTGGATLIKSAPTITGFTYYEYDIAQGTSFVSVSGNAIIDELRLYPKTARMRTVSYDPLIGKISECDENNRIIYYEYDNLGRLRFIKDESKNIVKMYEYNNVSPAKQNDCPATYYNHLIQEIFTKENCGTGYLGSDVVVSIAANTYSSAISQADADAKAENWLLTNGQTTANSTGSCLPIYYSTVQSQNFETECEEDRYLGNTVTYTVLARRYSSIISQADADEQALDDIDANGQDYANSFACTNTDPNWVWLDSAQTYCLSVNGQLPPHQFVRATDMNPLSQSYGQTSWQDAGPQAACPANTYYNYDVSGNYYKQNCPGGQNPQPYYVSVPPGTFSSIVSQADANNQARQYAQNLANQNGQCEPTVPIYFGAPNNCYTVEIYNSQTGFDEWFQGGVDGLLCTIPAGTYDVYIYQPTPTCDVTNRIFYLFWGCSSYYNYNGNFYGITLNANCTNYISIW
jgi:hypothetical protein